MVEKNQLNSLLEKALLREKKARQKAEAILENKVRELYQSKEEVQSQYEVLKRRSREIELLHQIAAFDVRNAALSEVMQFFVDQVCKASYWPVGYVYFPQEEDPNLLVSGKIWHFDEKNHYQRFREVREQINFKVKVGLPGRVLETRKTVWIEDAHLDSNFLRNELVKDLGVRGAFGVPIKVYGEVIAIAEFFSKEASPARKRLLEVVETAAIQLGTAFERKKAEREVQEKYEQLDKAHKKLQQAQAQLVQSEKMATLGQIAAGVAHEINNPVGFVMSNLGTFDGYVQVFKDLFFRYDRLTKALREENGEEARSILDQIEKVRMEEDLEYLLKDVVQLLKESKDGTDRVKEIVKNLKSFARLDESEIKLADINEGIESTLKIVWNELKYNCEVHKKLGNIPQIRCYPGQLNQVFMNLLVNASQAIAKKGEITIETHATESEIIIRVSDTGIGISKENLKRLFDPFFTTKGVGKGTGLGLSLAYGIIQKHNGIIEVESEEGEGTAFTIRLPVQGIRTREKEIAK